MNKLLVTLFFGASLMYGSSNAIAILVNDEPVTIYDIDWNQVIPENIKVINADTIIVSFGSSMAGRAMVLLF